MIKHRSASLHWKEAQKVDRSFYDEYFGFNLWLYQGPHFEVLQFVYPSTAGAWPWLSNASDWFRANQPVLTIHDVGTNAF